MNDSNLQTKTQDRSRAAARGHPTDCSPHRSVSRSTCKTNPSNAKPQEPKICNSNPTPNIKRSIWQTQNEPLKLQNQNQKPQELKISKTKP